MACVTINTLARQLVNNSCTEFHENPTDGLVLWTSRCGLHKIVCLPRKERLKDTAIHPTWPVVAILIRLSVFHRVCEADVSYPKTCKHYDFFPTAQQPPSGPGPPHYRGFTITLRHTPHSVGLLWTRDRPVAEFVSFRFAVLPSSTYLFTTAVEVVYFHLITLRHTTLGRTPLDEWSA
jgi:hypothetical protein